MQKKSTVISPANIAFIKYWGRRNDKLILPFNDSISMNMSNCTTKTTVEFGKFPQDEIKVKFFQKNFETLKGDQLNRVLNQVNRIRKIYKIKDKVKIYSENNFPADAGIAASASAFSALTLALFKALEINLTQKQLTIETRLAGSGSAARSICDGFVEWKMGTKNDSNSSYAHTLFDEKYWDLYDILAVVDTGRKKVGSFEGHNLAKNEYLKARLTNIKKRLVQLKEALKNKDFEKLGEIIEEDSISHQTVAMTSKPPIFYLNGRTWDVIFEIFSLREKGLLSYFTIDAGPNVHVICEAKDSQKISEKLINIPGVQFIIKNKNSKGSSQTDKHLF